MRRCKIVCTLGPATASNQAIEKLILSGMDIARLNFSHGDETFFKDLVPRIRQTALNLSRPVGILQDLQGPKMRTHLMAGGEVELVAGKTTTLTCDLVTGTKNRFSSQYAFLYQEVKPGDVIFLDDGKISLTCLSIHEKDILCEINHGGILKSNKGIHVPNGGELIASLSEKDRQDIHLGAKLSVDAVALSFVKSAQDLRLLKEELAKTKSKPLILAKIEKQKAFENLDEILEESDGIMVARGDLGVELPLEQVPIMQKEMVKRGLSKGKIVVVATQMLESMIVEPRPTRAEVSDVANGVLDGAGLLMLSGETASGQFPYESTQMMNRIIHQTEKSHLATYNHIQESLQTKHSQNFQNAVSLAAVKVADQIEAHAIVIFTHSGATARLISNYRPQCPILAFVPSVAIRQQLAFSWGVNAYVLHTNHKSDTLFAFIQQYLLEHQLLPSGARIVYLTKSQTPPSPRTNALQIHVLP